MDQVWLSPSQHEGFATPRTRRREQFVQRHALVAPTTQQQPAGRRTTGSHEASMPCSTASLAFISPLAPT
jgi:hypothetical protein